ncbi:MAG TPA: chromosome segregation protein SMC, partial [Firmicutes bacterium]|nr:chromosome segregation protein SMC [Bacillota bacterium]
FNNEDGGLPVPYSQVSVTRRAYRSGSSEFLLNGVPCRLKDIQELFWDTGLGREGYSFIGQGRVDEVLNLKAEERRVFLEQAAGVWRYRQRKKEAGNKLVEIEQDLVRLADVRTELERQRGPLQEEARRAEAYLAKAKRLKELEVFLGLRAIQELRERWEAAQAQVNAARMKLATLSGRRSQVEARLEKDKLELTEKEMLRAQEGDKARRLEEEMVALQKSLAELKAAERERAARAEGLAARREDIIREQAELEGEAAREEAELQSLHAARAEKRAALADWEAETRRVEAEQEAAARALTERRERTITLLSERAARANTLQALEREEQKLKERQERVRAAAHSAAARAVDLQAAREQARARLAAARQEVTAAQARRDTLRRELLQARAAEEEKRQQSQAAWRLAEQAKAELTSQRSLLESYAGYSQGARAVLRAHLPGIHGAVAELLEVPPGMEHALEAALGGAQEYLVAETDQAAAAAIGWLKEKELGRATFLPLNTVRPQVPRPEEQRLTAYPDVLGWAAELVGFAPRYQVIATHLLGRVLVARTLTAARAVARAAGYRLKVVTSEGDVLSPGGSMTGGSRRRGQRSLLTGTRRLRALEQACQAAESRLAEVEAQLEAARAQVAACEQQLAGCEAEIKKQEEVVSQAERRLAEYEAELAEVERSQRTWEEEEAALVRGLGEIAAQRTEAGERERRLGTDIERWEKETRAWEKKETELKERARAVREQATQVRLELAALEEQVKHLEVRQKERQEALTRLAEELAEHEARVREIGALEQAGREEQVRLEKEKASREAAWAQLQSRLSKLAAKVGDLRAAVAEEEKTARALRRQEDVLREEVHEEEVALERLSAEHAAAERRLFETHGIPEGASLPALELGAAEAEAEVGQLKAALAALGEVNLQAPRALAELEERCSFLTEQSRDLEAAKASLEKMMREIDRTVAQRLEDTYGCLRVSFQQVFRRLFGGGQADLVLTDAANILTSGLEIFAQLPGKKMQPLSLLSGGERALTGIAFLFALLTARSSCLSVLDEIDAALDEANAARFLNYLEELAGSTQFIMITHRKQAMQRAKSLYGLAMGAGGASRLVSIRLEEKEAV